MLETGNQQGALEIEQRSADLIRALGIDRRRWRSQRDVAGDAYDLGAYLAGDPECYYSERPVTQRRRGNKAPRYVRIAALASANADVTAQALANSGIYIAALVRALERASIGVALDLFFCTETFRNPCVFALRVRIKTAQERIDPALIAFAVAHPAFFRRIGFRLLEHQGQSVMHRLTSSYGHGRDIPDEIAAQYDIVLGQQFQERAGNYSRSADEQLADLRALLSAQGVFLRQ